ncbi:nuclear GTPase SLIP-GC-like [Conger conger]|uniref:nuclear GTPase SLIP-GC-like n=1 Tax=Conger conger TaxID=82655 RepID=UPI002A59D453|nr:nuclear GTPase SLIP-GC-like [Conger conger]
MKINRQSVFSHDTEELLLTLNDAFEDGKEAISLLEIQLKDVSSREEKTMSFLEDLKEKISGLKENNWKETIHIGLFGKTGAGKSSLINAIVQEELLPASGDTEACTSTFVHVQANTESSKYKADIEFISIEDWKSELHFLLELLENENDQQSTEKTDEEEEMVKMAKEKITAIYGEEGLERNYDELVGARWFPVILGTSMKTLTFDTADELSEGIECYIRSDTESDTNEGKQIWPLVKRVTISLPKSPALLEGIVLVDLPGAGDVSKCRSDMWKECLSQCSSVWIVNEMNRALSEKVADEIFNTSLRTIAGGGECHNVTFICTKTDVIKPKEIKKKYRLRDEDLKIDVKFSDNRGYHKTLKALCRNDGYFRSRKGVLVDLNYTLSEPMYKKMNENNLFLTTFGPGCTRASIKGTFESFQENFIPNYLLKEHKTPNKDKYLRLVYIRTEQRKVLKKLEKEILQRKKLIYNSLSDSIRDTMKQTYQECYGITGKDSFREMKGTLKSAIEDFKKTMFQNAMTKMLEEFSDLQDLLVTSSSITRIYRCARLGKGPRMSITILLNGLPWRFGSGQGGGCVTDCRPVGFGAARSEHFLCDLMFFEEGH